MKEKACPHHHVWEFDGKRRCVRCGKIIADSKRPSIEEQINLSELVKQLGNEKRKDNEGHLEEKSAAPQLLKCPNPKCGELSLFWNESLLLYECLNPRCRIKVSKAEFENIHPLEKQDMQESEFANPLLLTVRMFLADVRSWRQKYRDGEYMCADFAKEVYDAATVRAIRCGYVTVFFEFTNICHAIVAFETDYGLKFFEPQSGEEESVVVGRPYPIMMQGVPRGSIIGMVEIRWNDGTSTVVK